MKTNYHTHTARCRHASGTDEAFVKSAMEGGFSVLGFSDHTPWPYQDGYRSHIRMDVSELDGYVASIRSLQEKYQEQIEVKIGLECEYFPDYVSWLQEQQERLKLDYLLFGNHFPYREKPGTYFGGAIHTPADLQLYLESSLAGMESGLFACMAHPDLFLLSYYRFDEHCERIFREICKAACRLGIVLECNYSLAFCRECWLIAAEENCSVIIGTDAHRPGTLSDTEVYNRTVRALKETGITPIEKLQL